MPYRLLMANFVRAVGLVALVMAVAACGDIEDSGAGADQPISVIAQGRTGGPLPDEGCTWSLTPIADVQDLTRDGVTLERVDSSGGSGGSYVWREDDDDVVWIHMETFCVDAPTFVFGGVSDDVGSVVLTSGDEQVVLDVLDVPNHSWGAVIGELPRSWRSAGSFRVEAISKSDGAVLARESYPI